MKLIVFAASNNLNSINKVFATYAAGILKDKILSEVQVEVLDLNDYEMPIYRPDRESNEGVPQLAKDFYQKIGSADALIISFAEYNGSYTAAYKNLFDWTSRVGKSVYQNKSTLVLATSPGKRGAQSVLKAVLDVSPHFGMNVKGSFSLPDFQKNFDLAKGELLESEVYKEFFDVLQKFSVSIS